MMETASEIWNDYIRFNLVWVFLTGLAVIVYLMRERWREHWKYGSDGRFLGWNAEAFSLVAPLLFWMMLIGIPATVIDVILGSK